MNLVAILAGGVGCRMNGGVLPKQFIEVKGVPIIITTLKKCLNVKKIDIIYIAIHPSYKDYLLELIQTYDIKKDKIKIVNGGKERLNSIENVINDIYTNFEIKKDDVILIHDAVRPFVSEKLLERCIEQTVIYGATVPVVSAVDTMYIVENGILTAMPDRRTLYSGQTPDSFRIPLLKSALDSLTSEEREFITGTAQICMLKGIEVHTVEGDSKNIKLTTTRDLMVAEKFFEEETNE